MTQAVARRLLRAAATLLVAFLVCFFLLQALPGDPTERLDSPSVPAAQAERNRRALGLDRPPVARLVRTLSSYLAGDLGVSFARKRPVAEVLAAALPPTLLLGATALALAYGAGSSVAIALVALPRRRRRALDRLLLAFAVVPRFLLGVMLILVLHGIAGWFPASHATSPGGGGPGDRLWHLVLPALALGLPAACVVARFQLAVMERTLDASHVRAARAGGAGGLRLLTRHVLQPSLGPTVALAGVDLPLVVSGAIVVETVFAWPGVGRLTAEAVLLSDYPLALAAALLSVTFVIVGRLAAQALAARLDPRAETSRGAA